MRYFYILTILLLVGCSIVPKEELEKKDKRIAELENNLSLLEENKLKLSEENEKFINFINKILDDWRLFQEFQKKLIIENIKLLQENSKLGQKFYQDRIEQYQKILQEREEIVKKFESEANVLATKKDYKVDLNKTESSINLENSNKNESSINLNKNSKEVSNKDISKENNFSMKNVEEKKRILSQLRNKLVSINYWSIEDEKRFHSVIKSLDSKTNESTNEAENFYLEISKRN